MPSSRTKPDADPAAKEAALLETNLKQLREKSRYLNISINKDDIDAAMIAAFQMLQVLATDGLHPTSYFLLFSEVTDKLGNMCIFLQDVTSPQDDDMLPQVTIDDMFERVQEYPEIIPRLYMMILVGSIILERKRQQPRSLLRAIWRMCRGVQDPIRGLFLRYFANRQLGPGFPDSPAVVTTRRTGPPTPSVSGTSETMPEANTTNGTSMVQAPHEGNVLDSVDFLLRNFADMSVLWDAIGYGAGTTREEIKRVAEWRDAVNILPVSTLQRLSQLDSLTPQMYVLKVLPALLQSLIGASGTKAKTYLLNCIVMAFKDEFHIIGIWLLFDTMTKIAGEFDIIAVVPPLLDRLASFLITDNNKEIAQLLIEDETATGPLKSPMVKRTEDSHTSSDAPIEVREGFLERGRGLLYCMIYEFGKMVRPDGSGFPIQILTDLLVDTLLFAQKVWGDEDNVAVFDTIFAQMLNCLGKLGITFLDEGEESASVASLLKSSFIYNLCEPSEIFSIIKLKTFSQLSAFLPTPLRIDVAQQILRTISLREAIIRDLETCNTVIEALDSLIDISYCSWEPPAKGSRDRSHKNQPYDLLNTLFHLISCPNDDSKTFEMLQTLYKSVLKSGNSMRASMVAPAYIGSITNLVRKTEDLGLIMTMASEVGNVLTVCKEIRPSARIACACLAAQYMGGRLNECEAESVPDKEGFEAALGAITNFLDLATQIFTAISTPTTKELTDVTLMYLIRTISYLQKLHKFDLSEPVAHLVHYVCSLDSTQKFIPLGFILDVLTEDESKEEFERVLKIGISCTDKAKDIVQEISILLVLLMRIMEIAPGLPDEAKLIPHLIGLVNELVERCKERITRLSTSSSNGYGFSLQQIFAMYGATMDAINALIRKRPVFSDLRPRELLIVSLK